MAALKQNAASRYPKCSHSPTNPLACAMREFEELVREFEVSLSQSLGISKIDDRVRREACRLAISDISDKYTRKYISQSLYAAESEGRRVEELLHALTLDGTTTCVAEDAEQSDLGGMHNGYFRLYSTELFDLLGQPTDLRFGSLRLHKHSPSSESHATMLNTQTPWVHVELALNNSFFVADSTETLPYHSFRLPATPSLQNRGILSRKPEDNGTFPHFDSWLLFTFLGNGCLKLEVPIEMCADIYGDRLGGRENVEVVFWGFFVDDV
ncbi:hypothetical protein DE146DRAFT_455891 [Phaeosphaeria sp. MPI-PUGE-AT-0046c]|nr:hypothetical protein DE146DRAFT_455891 [Phaeosphaeria sp. MPI-PUGE-AT-0046c]